jgi:isopenicillin N synthase-like dioxygenase
MIIYTAPLVPTSIPVIDLTKGGSPDLDDRRAVAWEIHKACRETGFFYVSNHGVPDAVMSRQLDWTRRFFDQAVACKNEVSFEHSPWKRGYEGMRRQTLDAGSPPDLKEGFMYAGECGPDHPYVRKHVPQYGPNQWPAELSGFREQMLDYQARMEALGRRLLRLMALSVDLPEHQFDDGLDNPMCSVRLLHYPPHPDQAAFNQLGAGAHTDWGTITILLQDDCGGLEVQNANGNWIRASPIPGTFIINLGDMVRRWTNDLYQSTMHRVLNNIAERDRYSIATFFNPDYFYRVECLPTCQPADGLPTYAPCTVGEHILEMFHKTYQIAPGA